MEIYLNPDNVFVATFIGAPSMNIFNASLYPEYIELEGRKLNLYKKMPVAREGMEVKMGIRPDFFQDGEFADKNSQLLEIKGIEVDLVEPLGYDRELDLRLGKKEFKARLDLRTRAREGERINLCFDPARVHFFDPETEKNIFSGIFSGAS